MSYGYGQIRRKALLTELFRDVSEIVEVRVNKAFTLSADNQRFFILLNYDINLAALWDRFMSICGATVRIQVTMDLDDPIFMNTELLWKGGVWYR